VDDERVAALTRPVDDCVAVTPGLPAGSAPAARVAEDEAADPAVGVFEVPDDAPAVVDVEGHAGTGARDVEAGVAAVLPLVTVDRARVVEPVGAGLGAVVEVGTHDLAPVVDAERLVVRRPWRVEVDVGAVGLAEEPGLVAVGTDPHTDGLAPVVDAVGVGG
jgi:hypothetical protein